MMTTRRWNFPTLYFCLFVGLFLLLCSPVSPGAVETLPAPEKTSRLQRLNGLDRHYDLSFLWFDRLALGQLTFTRDPLSPKRYLAVLDAKTLGVAAWLTGERVQRYETLMELTPQGRFRPLEYRSMINKTKEGAIIKQTKLYTFDAATRTITMIRSKDGKKGVAQPVNISGDLFPVDFLTAGFNFISGADGPIRVGDHKEIVTFTDKGPRKILIEVLKAKDWPKTSFFKKGSGTLLKVILPSEILDTDGGAVYALLDEKGLPHRVIVENVLGLGDVKGTLRP